MYAHQGQLVIFSTTFRTPAGVPVDICQSDPTKPGANPVVPSPYRGRIG